MIGMELQGWDRLRHGGLLLDPPRLSELAAIVPAPLSSYDETEMRRRAAALVGGDGNASEFIAFVLDRICGFTEANGTWKRGSNVGTEWSRVTVTGEHVKPRQIWQCTAGGLLPVFMDSETRIGIGRGRKATSLVLQWLRAGTERLALLTNGQQWRLCFAGLDFDAWCEWDLDLWFEEGQLSPQVFALRSLLQPELWRPASPNTPCPLLQAILDSRKGQAELSQVLGERVREAVEILVQGHGEILKERCPDVDPSEIYRAAVRMVMRLVVVLFAESRDLLPRDNSLYHGAYGLGGLLEDLERTAARGGNRLAQSWNAWPRILALFRLVYQGSHHPNLGIPAYGGELFASGDAASNDGLTRALAVFETACFEREMISDRDIHRMLERITRTRVNIRQGRGSTSIPVPVDFSDLSSEYIGILYEGLLDFELRTAPSGDPVIFLAIGNQPALPLSRLEEMSDTALGNLLEKMKQTRDKDSEETEETEEQEVVAEESTAEEATSNDDPIEEESDTSDADDATRFADARHATRTRAETWARRAVVAGGLAARPRGRLTAEKQLQLDAATAKIARQLVSRVVLPGEWYLVRWGGTRKGSGTFYTRPGLAVPTVHRTLRPLAWNPPVDSSGKEDTDALPSKWSPKLPEEILSLKVVDPACGSGTFPVAALRFFTESLFASLHHHGRILSNGDRAVVALLQGSKGADGRQEKLCEELMPCRPDDVSFEPRLKAILRRHVVERCVYGVDLDPLAVELCRLALWIETMDRTLPFSFLDHKIKCGNSLIGAWFDQFQHYPVMAWKNREGGDKSHSNGVHFKKEARTKTIKAFVEEELKPDIKKFIEGRTLLETRDHQKEAFAVHDEVLVLLSRLHDLPVQDADERSRIYRDELLQSRPFLRLKEAMDRWCSCWLWPADDLSIAPLPTAFANPSAETLQKQSYVSLKHRFFHWELEFPDVYRSAGLGFDAVLGNPPWNIGKPNSKEFFSNVDPLYRSYGKQEAKNTFQVRYFSDERIERQWLDYNADFRAQSNFVKFGKAPYGDPEHDEESFNIVRGRDNELLHFRWQQARSASKGYAEPAHPYRHQGSADINLYKLFLEKAYSLLRPGGRLGFIVPSGLYSDHGTGALRRLFLDQSTWEWLFGFENREGIFEIDSRFKFNPIIVQKGGRTQLIRTAFMRRKLEDWEHAESFVTIYARERVERFSPRSKAILEVQSERELEILEKIYSNSVLLGDEGPNGWGIKYATEFHMTNDSAHFPQRPKWEAQGYRPDEYSRWLKGDWRPIELLWAELGVRPLPPGEARCAQPPYDRLPIPRADIPAGVVLSREVDAWIREDRIADSALPVFQGRMIWQMDSSRAEWVGPGPNDWSKQEWPHKRIAGQFLMGVEHWSPTGPLGQVFRLGFRDVQNATNQRTFITTMLPAFPATNKVPILRAQTLTDSLALLSSAISFQTDRSLRLKMSQGTVNWFYVAEVPVLGRKPSLTSDGEAAVRINQVASLSLPGLAFSSCWVALRNRFSRDLGWRALWAISENERTRIRVQIDALNSLRFGLSMTDLQWLLKDCDLPSDRYASRTFLSRMDAKGFWRVDRDKDPELRHSVLTLVAFQDLLRTIERCSGDQDQGVEVFLKQNGNEGWMLPETLCLADYGLGHDDRAKTHQPVASRLGPRFYNWQLAQSAEQSWRECHLHARNLLGEAGYQRLLADVETEQQGGSPPPIAEPNVQNRKQKKEPTLF